MSKTMQYVARENNKFKQKDVDIIAPYLRETLFPDGMFDEDIALADAKKKSSPLHKYLDWNDSTAAHKYRINQIKDMFVCFRIVPVGGDSELPGVLNLEIANSRQYVATDIAMQSPDLCEQAVRSAIAGLREWQRRYTGLMQYPEFKQVHAAISLVVNSQTLKTKGATNGKGKESGSTRSLVGATKHGSKIIKNDRSPARQGGRSGIDNRGHRATDGQSKAARTHGRIGSQSQGKAHSSGKES